MFKYGDIFRKVTGLDLSKNIEGMVENLEKTTSKKVTVMRGDYGFRNKVYDDDIDRRLIEKKGFCFFCKYFK